MNQEAVKQPIDELLLAFLNAAGEAESEAALEELICNHAQPLIKQIVRFKLQPHSSNWDAYRDAQEVEDVVSEVILRLVRALRQRKASPQANRIVSLRSYVATIAYNASDEYVRHKYPRRFSLKNRIKYILTHQPGLALWESESKQMYCGYERWRQANPHPAKASGFEQLPRKLESVLQKRFAGRALDQLNPGDVLSAVFDLAEAPLEIDALVSLMAEIWSVHDLQPQVASDDSRFDAQHNLSVVPQQKLDEVFDHRARLAKVWSEIRQLPVRQRAALLLNLRDEQGGAAIMLLPILRIATITQIAEVLEISVEEMAAVWNDLPLEDIAIARRLEATPQQVVNLRKSARQRLARRLVNKA